MRIEYINHFVDSVSSALHDLLRADPRRGEMYVKSSSTPILGVAAYVGLFGDLEGRVIYDMSEETALAISSEMNMEAAGQLDDRVKASLKELSAIITKQAVSGLNELGFTLDSIPPAIITGTTMEISDPEVEALICSVDSKHGKIEVNVAVQEKS